MAEILDLFGDPVPENRGRRGRPQHIPTNENRNKVSMLLALGWANLRIAHALNITLPTLHKHYFYELRFREVARDRLDAKVAMMIYEQCVSGNVAAMKEFQRLVERNDLMLGRSAVRPDDADESASSPEKIGKKAAAERDAQTAHEGTEWGKLLPH